MQIIRHPRQQRALRGDGTLHLSLRSVSGANQLPLGGNIDCSYCTIIVAMPAWACMKFGTPPPVQPDRESRAK